MRILYLVSKGRKDKNFQVCNKTIVKLASYGVFSLSEQLLVFLSVRWRSETGRKFSKKATLYRFICY